MSENTITLAADDITATALKTAITTAVNSVGKYAAYVEAHGVTRENVKDHAVALAVFTYPSLDQVQTETVDGKKTRTKFGNAVQAAGAGLRAALPKSESKDTDYIKKIVKAVEAALGHDIQPDQVKAAVKAALKG